MSAEREPIRSYQRIFTPERRIHQVDGRPLPVPGGVSLRWLGWALGSAAIVVVLGMGSATVLVGAAAAAGAGGLVYANRTAGLLAAAAALAGTWATGQLLGLLDWPLRLILIPVAVATAATQATPDGRRPERFAASWLLLRLAPARRSLGRGLPATDTTHRHGGRVWVDGDSHGHLRRGRVSGPAVISFAAPVVVERGAIRRSRLVARPQKGERHRGQSVTRLVIGDGETVEVRP